MKKMDFFTQKAVDVCAEKDIRLDAGETAMLERELTQLRAKVFKTEYPDLIARTLVPLATDIDQWAETFAYKVWDKKGQAKIGANDADDAPMIDVEAREVTGKVFPITAGFKYGIQELENAARRGVRLDQFRAMATRDAIEEGVDNMLAFGDTNAPGESNLVTQGLLNHSDIAGAGDARVIALTDWDTNTTAATFITELNSLINPVAVDSKDRFMATDIVLPTNRYRLIASKPYGVDSDRTVLSWFTNNNNVRITSWHRAQGIGTNSNGRALVYRKDPMVLEGVVPMEYTQLPPQARNYAFVVPTMARCGGVKVYQPTAAFYGDFAA